jgi:hypothetical protein
MEGVAVAVVLAVVTKVTNIVWDQTDTGDG